MSKIIPFDALLPSPKLASFIISPPYDVVKTERARELIKDNPYSFLRLTKPEATIPGAHSPYDDVVYKRALENFLHFQKEGFLVQDTQSFYIYRQVMGAHIQTGLVCGVSVDEYEDGRIKRHELTCAEKVTERARLAYTIGAHLEPVFLVFKKNVTISSLLEDESGKAPLYDITDGEGVRHILWRTKKLNEFRRLLGEVGALYIADGHHRSEAARIVRNMMKKENPDYSGRYNYFPATIFSDSEVKVFEYNWDGKDLERPLSRFTMANIIAYADGGKIMPHKSTWFAPKLASGLFTFKF